MSQTKCTGDGSCFEFFHYYLPFIIKKDFTCNCTLINCSNFHICKRKITQSIFNKCNGLCLDCFLKNSYDEFAFVKQNDNMENCPICGTNHFLYKLMNCDHYACSNCVFKLYYYDFGKLEDYPIIPSFPYDQCTSCEKDNCKCENYTPDGTHAYFENDDDPKWLSDPKIKEWKLKDDAFEEFCDHYIKKPSSNLCPLCNQT